jgi:hypothetical protein
VKRYINDAFTIRRTLERPASARRKRIGASDLRDRTRGAKTVAAD